ncbi:bacteriocin-like protein [Chryseobacterium cucumeris]
MCTFIFKFKNTNNENFKKLSRNELKAVKAS